MLQISIRQCNYDERDGENKVKTKIVVHLVQWCDGVWFVGVYFSFICKKIPRQQNHCACVIECIAYRSFVVVVVNREYTIYDIHASFEPFQRREA